MRYVKIKIYGTETDEEILSIVGKLPNGSYCTKVCRGCGMFFCNENGDIRTAKVVDVCRRCVKV